MKRKQKIYRLQMSFYGISALLNLLLRQKIRFKQFIYTLKKQKAVASLFQYAKLSKTGKKIFIHSYIPHFPSKYFDQAILNNCAETYPLKPTYATVAITSRCPCNCIYCHARESLKEEPSKELILRVISEISQCEFPVINFTGGEPFSRFNDLLDFMKLAGKNMDTRMFSSGVGSSYDRLKQLKDAGLNCIMVSLDHHEESIHNAQRRNKTAFKSSCACIKDSVKLGLHVEVVSCTTNSDITSGSIFKTVDFIESLGAHTVQIHAIKPAGNALRFGDKDFFMTKENRLKMIEYYRTQNNSSRPISIVLPWHDEEADHFGCTAVAGQHAYIDPQGHVMPCSLLALSLGNVKQESFKTIWDNFTKNCEHAVDRCMVHYLSDRLRREPNLPLPPEKTFELWPELKALPRAGIATRIDIKKRINS